MLSAAQLNVLMADAIWWVFDELLNDMGTILIGKQAVDSGLIDEVGGISRAIEKLNEMIGEES